MKNKTLLKVLSATAIFSAIAAIEAYDHESYIFANEEVRSATNSSENVTSQNNSNSSTSNSTSETTSNQYKSLKNGEYSIEARALNFNVENTPSMASAGLDNTKTKLIVEDEKYTVNVTFNPITIGKNKGYLGDLKYYDGDKTHENRREIADSEFKETKIIDNYTKNENDEYSESYYKKYPNRNVYPKTFSYSVDKNKIDINNQLETYTQVFVPIMDYIQSGAGVQNMILTYDFNKLKPLNVNNEKNTDTKFVKLSVKDDTITTPKVRKNVDTIGKILRENNEDYLVFNYYSKVGEGRKNDGIQNIKYSNKEIQNAKDSELLLPTSNKVIETIKSSEEIYEISEVKIPITGKKEIVVYGDFQYPAKLMKQYGTITWNDKNVEVNHNVKVDEPKLFSIKAMLGGTSIKKASEPNKEYDFTKDGITYTPYNGLSGNKFKLAKHYYHTLEMSFERDNLINTKTRHIKYTIDGSKPTFKSQDATVKFANANPHKPEFLYSINIDPFAEGTNITSNGGNVTVKVKAFNNDGTESSDTKTYVLPFEKETLDKAETTLNINNKEYTATLSSKNKFLLDDDVVIKTTPVSERIMNHTLDSKIQELGLTRVNTFKFDLTKKDGTKFTPLDKDGWNINENPIFTLNIAGYEATANTQVYIYENGVLRLIPSTPSKKGVEFNVNSDEAYFVIAEKDSQVLKNEKTIELKNKVNEIEKILSETNVISTAKSNLEAELEKIKKTLAKPKVSLSTLVLHLENLDINQKKLKLEKTTDIKYLQNNFKTLTNIVNSDILTQLLTKNKIDELKSLVSKSNNSLNDASALQNNIKELYESLNNLSYRYPTQDIDYSIKKFYRENETSMANNVFTNKGKLIFTPNKTYLDLDLKTMLFGSMHSHLLEIDVFKDKIDGEKSKYYVVNKYDDLNSLTGEIGNFDKKLIVELEKEVKNIYDIRVPNDGMGNSRPEAKLVITTKINRPEVLSDEEKAEKERIEAEKLAKEKIEKERLEKEKPIVTAKGEAAILKVPEFDLEGYIKNHQGPITAKGEAAILDKPEFDLEEYIRNQKGSIGEVPSNAVVPYNSKEEFTNKNKENDDFKDSTNAKETQDRTETTSTPKPLINDIFGQSEVKDTFIATPVNTKENTKNTLDIKKSLANTGTTATTTGFFGLITLLTAFVLRRKANK